jgi:D-amino-acid dehydrogenase
VIVIGGGIVGASATYHLAAAGADVVLVDRSDEGQATAAGAGVVFPWPAPGTAAPFASLGTAAAEQYPRMIEELVDAGIYDPGYARAGSILVADEGPVLDAVHQVLVETGKQPGMSGMGEIERLSPGEPAARFPVLSPSLAGVWTQGTGRVDGRVLRNSLVRLAIERGAVRRAASADLFVDGDAVKGAIIDDEIVGADAVVVAAGAWSALLCEPLGVTIPVFPQRGQIVHLGVDAFDTGDWPIVTTLEEHYLLAFPDGRVVAGATRESDSGFAFQVTSGGLRKVLADALSIAPGLAAGSVIEVRVGFRPFSPDGLPSLGSIDGIEGLVIATGLGRVGLTLGPCVGGLAADLALGRAVPIDLEPYRPDRPTVQT